MDTKGFAITEGKGFQITFENGFTVSVQFGPGDYCDNYHDRNSDENRQRAGEEGSNTAECAVFAPNGEPLPHFNGEIVSNRSKPAQVLELLNWAALQPRATNG